MWFMRRGMNFKFQPRNGIIRESNFRSIVLLFCIFFLFFLDIVYHTFISSCYLIWDDVQYWLRAKICDIIRKTSSFWRIALSSMLRNGWSTLSVCLFITEKNIKTECREYFSSMLHVANDYRDVENSFVSMTLAAIADVCFTLEIHLPLESSVYKTSRACIFPVTLLYAGDCKSLGH